MINSYYEVRVDGQKVAAYGNICPDALEKSRSLIKETRHTLYKDKVLQIVALKIDELPTGKIQFTEQLIYEEHPTVMDVDGFIPTPYTAENPFWNLRPFMKEVV